MYDLVNNKPELIGQTFYNLYKPLCISLLLNGCGIRQERTFHPHIIAAHVFTSNIENSENSLCAYVCIRCLKYEYTHSTIYIYTLDRVLLWTPDSAWNSIHKVGRSLTHKDLCLPNIGIKGVYSHAWFFLCVMY